MAEFAGTKVGPNMFRLLEAARWHFLSLEYTGSPNAARELSPADQDVFANMPEVSVYTAMTDPGNLPLLPQAFAELWRLDVTSSRLSFWGPAPGSGFYRDDGIHSQLLALLARVLTELLWSYPGTSRLASHRFHRINGLSLYNYGMRREEYDRTSGISLTPITSDQPCQGRIFGLVIGGNCRQVATIAVNVPKRGSFIACNRCAYGAFRPEAEWGTEPGFTWKDQAAKTRRRRPAVAQPV